MIGTFYGNITADLNYPLFKVRNTDQTIWTNLQFDFFISDVKTGETIKRISYNEVTHGFDTR